MYITFIWEKNLCAVDVFRWGGVGDNTAHA